MKKRSAAALLITCFALSQIPQAVCAQCVNVPAGTALWAALDDKYTSENIKAGQPISATIKNNITINNVVVFKKGAKAEFIVDEASKRRFCGGGGYLTIKKAIAPDTNNIEHTFIIDKKVYGSDRDWVPPLVISSFTIILAPFALFAFVKGQSAVLDKDAMLEAKLEKGFVLNIK